MLKKIIHDDNSEIINSFYYAIFYMICFLLILSPIVLIAIKLNPNILETAYVNVNGNQGDFFKTIDVINTFIEFFILGIISEFVRRKKSKKFKMFDKESKIFYIMTSTSLLIHITTTIIKVLMINNVF